MLGTSYISKGAKRLLEPGVKRFVVIPLLINIVLYGVIFGYTLSKFDEWIDALLFDWLSWIKWLLMPFLIALLLLILSYTFVMMANILGSPFHALLAEEVEIRIRRERGETIAEQPFQWGVCFRSMFAGLTRTLGKLLYTIPRLVGVLIISFIPVVNIIAPVIWVIFGSWMYALEYWDWAAENNQTHLKESVAEMKGYKIELFGFGLSVYVLALIPLINLVIIPIAVAGGVELWLDKHPASKSMHDNEVQNG